jgi:hypothetical protein
MSGVMTTFAQFWSARKYETLWNVENDKYHNRNERDEGMEEKLLE